MFQPTLFGKYLLTDRIAVGGMAEIFKAKVFGVGGFEKSMVVKQILPQYAKYREFVDMFIDEAKITVSLTHGNIVPVYELGRIEGIYFIAMEYVHGKDLGEIFMRSRELDSPLAPEQAVTVIIEALKGLDYAHRRKDKRGRPMGIVHRDVSPQNVIVSYEGDVKICDFGIAKARVKLVETHPGAVKGKFGYHSPELARGEDADKRSDIFSTGVVLWELLTNERLFGYGTEAGALERVKRCEVERPSVIRETVPEALDEILLRALAKDPQDRYKDAATFQLALSKFLFTTGSPVTSTSIAGYMRRLFSSDLAADEARENDPERIAVEKRLFEELNERVRTGESTARRRTGRQSPTTRGEPGSRRTPTGALSRRSGGTQRQRTGPARRGGTQPATPIPTGANADELDALLGELEAEAPAPAPAATDQPQDPAFQYEVFAARDGDDEAQIHAAEGRRSNLVWALILLCVLGGAGYLLVTQTNIFRRKKKTAAPPPPPTLTAKVRLRTKPAALTSGKANDVYPDLWWQRGRTPAKIADVPLGSDQEVLVELSGYGSQRVTIPRSVWTPIPGARGSRNRYEYRLRVTLTPGATQVARRKIPDRGGGTPPPPNATGRLIVESEPLDAQVWLHMGAPPARLLGLDPRKPHRFSAELPGHVRAYVSLRPFRSPDDPGDWKPNTLDANELSFDPVIELKPLPTEPGAKPTPKKKKKKKPTPPRNE